MTTATLPVGELSRRRRFLVLALLSTGRRAQGTAVRTAALFEELR
ncbi:hypothetical protein OHB01_14990 [Microbispora hainanensis]|uniref:Transcriptional regulator n=1 Tax=Microbispora hainanensis TaxID=568844 RepID=A0ABZ1SJD2_9ACTN|nr:MULTISPECIES: hypothetical protein [Microbispora]